MKKLLCLLLALLTIGGCALAETENKTDEAVLKALKEGKVDYDVVDVDEGDLTSFNGAEVLEVESE